MDARNGPENSVLVVEREQLGITAMCVNCGTMTQPKAFITVTIVVYVGKVEVLGKIFSIARSVA